MDRDQATLVTEQFEVVLDDVFFMDAPFSDLVPDLVVFDPTMASNTLDGRIRLSHTPAFLLRDTTVLEIQNPPNTARISITPMR